MRTVPANRPTRRGRFQLQQSTARRYLRLRRRRDGAVPQPRRSQPFLQQLQRLKGEHQSLLGRAHRQSPLQIPRRNRGRQHRRVEAVASLDRQGNFYFVSNRSYDQTASTLYRGKFVAGKLSSIELIPGVSRAQPGIVNFDAEISADGNTLYFVESQFSMRGQPQWAKILIARRSGDKFIRDDQSSTIMNQVNAGTLNYAPATTESQCELFFTRVTATGPATFVANRKAKGQPFQNVRRIAAITGFAEAPTLSPDGLSLYFHKRENDSFVLYRVTRNAQQQAAVAAGGCGD